MQRSSTIFLTIFLLIFIGSALALSYVDISYIGNVLGLLSIVSYVFTLMPGIVKTLTPKAKRHSLVIGLMRNRRQIGVASFCFGAQHGLFIVMQRSLDLMNMHTYMQYIHGSILFGIFSLLTITSNNESVKFLKKKWQHIHQLTYIIPAILVWHVLDNMNKRTWVTPIAEGLIYIAILLLITKLYFLACRKGLKIKLHR
ncbi:MAG: iron reductase [Cyanobacteria bacterium P01_F01_bin.150]